MLSNAILTDKVSLPDTSGAPQQKTQKSSSKLGKAMQLTPEQESGILTVFESCGIGEIKTANQVQEGEEETSYHLKDVETSHYNTPIVVWVRNSDKTIESIYYGDHTIYENGTPISLVSLYYVSSDMRTAAKLAAESLVKQCLNVPNSAKFKSDWTFAVQDGFVYTQATVVSKNLYGVDLEAKFQVKFDQITATPVSVIIDGKEYMS